ncbi:PHP domain protein [Gloeothece citriformis PCC 7424]|uniref:PHP domain protein n=1 Tax=Gloeothece citriformis (strain PCC 7424) TaxID=65393 RepID=B7K9V1_GLOC7|nr:PHP domain-containing protein [Gloeothece citriformis]ACK71307.1 PHP domain protein [Gloeothece citriformis PCC 7424]
MVVTSATQAEAHNTTILREVWANINLNSCPYHYNFHMHTTCSDGKLSPVALIEQAVKIGLKGMAITDHHSTQGYKIAQEWLEELRLRQPLTLLPHLWTGIEVTSNLVGTEVHILGYGFNPQHSALTPYLQGTSPQGENAHAKRVIDALHQAGGLVILAHPSRYSRPAEDLVPLAAELGVDGIEAFYAYGNPKPWQPSSKQTEKALQLSEKYGLFTTCGTDTHGSNLLHRI